MPVLYVFHLMCTNFSPYQYGPLFGKALLIFSRLFLECSAKTNPLIMIEYCSLIVFVKLCAGLPAPHVGVRNCFFQFGVSGLVRICIWREGEKMGVRLAQAKTGPLHCIGKFTASPMISFQRESSFGNLVVCNPSKSRISAG